MANSTKAQSKRLATTCASGTNRQHAGMPSKGVKIGPVRFHQRMMGRLMMAVDDVKPRHMRSSA